MKYGIYIQFPKCSWTPCPLPWDLANSFEKVTLSHCRRHKVSLLVSE
jgi:hypothetical protein